MKNKRNLLITMLTVFSMNMSMGQDTASMIKDFNKVMSFSVVPYLYYSTTTTISSNPVMDKEDTLKTQGEFYKYENDLFYKNENEEIYLQDSFYIRVNHKRKEIWVSKVDVGSKEKMNKIPLANKELQALFRKSFTISKELLDKDTDRLNFESKQYFDSVSMVLVNIGLKYAGKTFIPQLLEMNITMKQAVDDIQLLQLRESGIPVQLIGERNYFTKTQNVLVTFSAVSNEQRKAKQMPGWRSVLDFNSQQNEFTVHAGYEDYEITKTF